MGRAARLEIEPQDHDFASGEAAGRSHDDEQTQQDELACVVFHEGVSSCYEASLEKQNSEGRYGEQADKDDEDQEKEIVLRFHGARGLVWHGSLTDGAVRSQVGYAQADGVLQHVLGRHVVEEVEAQLGAP